MSVSTPERRIALFSARGLAGVGAAYLLTGTIWLLSGGLQSADPFRPADPFLAILELLILLSALLLVALMAALHAVAPPDRKTHALAAFAFTLLFAALTSSVHFVMLTSGRQAHLGGTPAPLLSWPSPAMAVDFLAWDVCLGLALLFAAPIFAGRGLETGIRHTMFLSGTLCLAGVLGPASGDLRLQWLAIVGYAVGFPVACALVAIRFAPEKSSTRGADESALRDP